MVFFNVNATPDENAATVLPDGGYNFACVTPEENDTIISLLSQANEFPYVQRGIALAFLSENTVYKPRYIVNQILIEYSEQTDGKLDKAAGFIAYSRKGSAYREKAIKAFEQLDANMAFPQSVSGLEMYSWSGLYLIAAELYEKEYQLEKALCAIDSSQKNGWDKAVCVERHAEILAKIDINQAVEYLQNKIEADPALTILSGVLRELQAKAAKGYKFKPRKKAPEDNLNMEQQLRRLAYRYLKKA